MFSPLRFSPMIAPQDASAEEAEEAASAASAAEDTTHLLRGISGWLVVTTSLAGLMLVTSDQ